MSDLKEAAKMVVRVTQNVGLNIPKLNDRVDNGTLSSSDRDHLTKELLTTLNDVVLELALKVAELEKNSNS